MIESNSEYNRENPSEDYTDLLKEYKLMHKASEGMFNGRSLVKFVETLGYFLKRYKCESLLDYGCGKGTLYTQNYRSVTDAPEIDRPLQELWEIDKLTLFDPAYPKHDKLPVKEVYDAVICTDVLEHIPTDDLEWVIREVFSFSSNLVFLNVACMEALKKLKDGRNAHVSLFTSDEWLQFIAYITEDFPWLTVYVFADEFNSERLLETKGFKIIPRPTIIPLKTQNE